MRIFLLGFMGAGKTRLGKELAQLMNYPFVDLDQLITEETAMSISSVFEQYGETYFRKIEKKLLQESNLHEDVIFSTGGGTPCFFNNIDWINENGLSIYLDVDQRILFDRLWKGKHKRPLLNNLSKTELSIFINEKIKMRMSFYLQASIHYQILIEDQKSAYELFQFLKINTSTSQINDKY